MSTVTREMIDAGARAICPCTKGEPCPDCTDAAEKVLHAVITRLRSESEKAVGDWQPIETAPKDGTEILLSIPYSSGPGVTIAVWTETPRTKGWRQGSKHGAQLWIDPTHWRPLPAPPINRPISPGK